MNTDHQDPTRQIPITEVIPRHTAVPPAHRSASSAESGLPVGIIPRAAHARRSALPGLIGIAIVAAVGGGALWYWWTSSPPPVQYKTALVDRGPITAIVTATGTVNPVVSVLVGSQVSGKIA